MAGRIQQFAVVSSALRRTRHDRDLAIPAKEHAVVGKVAVVDGKEVPVVERDPDASSQGSCSETKCDRLSGTDGDRERVGHDSAGIVACDIGQSYIMVSQLGNLLLVFSSY
jgi:hypothetical protein